MRRPTNRRTRRDTLRRRPADRFCIAAARTNAVDDAESDHYDEQGYWPTKNCREAVRALAQTHVARNPQSTSAWCCGGRHSPRAKASPNCRSGRAVAAVPGRVGPPSASERPCHVAGADHLTARSGRLAVAPRACAEADRRRLATASRRLRVDRARRKRSWRRRRAFGLALFCDGMEPPCAPRVSHCRTRVPQNARFTLRRPCRARHPLSRPFAGQWTC
jgi:hypothetical protein